MKNLILIAALLTILELSGIKGILVVLGNIVILYIIWKAIGLVTDVIPKAPYSKPPPPL